MEMGHPSFEDSAVSSLREAIRKEQHSFREEKRSLLLRSKRVRLDDAENSIQDISPEKLIELAVIVRKGKADVACLKEIRKAVCVGDNIEKFMRVNGVLPALNVILTGKDPDKQMAAVDCFINLTCGSHAVTHKIARAVGVYLIVYVQSSSYFLQDLCAWALGNIANDCQDCFNLLMVQGLLPAVVGLLQSTFPEVIHSAVYCLRACTKYQNSLSDLMQLSLPKHIISVLPRGDLSHDTLVDTAFTLCNICYQIAMEETFEMQTTVADSVLYSLHEAVKEDVADISMATPLVRCLGYLTCRSDTLCEVLCCHPSLNKCISRIFHLEFHHLKKELLWALTNILLSSKISKSFFDVDPVLNGIHIFLSVLDSDVLLALYFLSVLVHIKPETRKTVLSRGLLVYVEAVMSCGEVDLVNAANVFYTTVTS